ncbi:MAG: RNA pseudouridine synthase [Patescibacteria group bacterium]
MKTASAAKSTAKNKNVEKTPTPEVVSETNDYLVINKPAGLAVHAGGNLTEPTLVDWLVAHYPKIKRVGDDPIRPGLVHRLDRDVSGLMVIAKSQASFASLKNQFKDREVNKEYIALVHGQLIPEEGAIDFPITRSRSGHKMAALPAGTEELLLRRHPRGRDQGNIESWLKSRAALTEFTVLKRFVNYSLLRVRIKTGRTHQIRVHFFALGYPLVGDSLYYTKKTKEKNKKMSLGRVFLVADRLSFHDLAGQKQNFSLDLPTELAAALPQH